MHIILISTTTLHHRPLTGSPGPLSLAHPFSGCSVEPEHFLHSSSPRPLCQTECGLAHFPTTGSNSVTLECITDQGEGSSMASIEVWDTGNEGRRYNESMGYSRSCPWAGTTIINYDALRVVASRYDWTHFQARYTIRGCLRNTSCVFGAD